MRQLLVPLLMLVLGALLLPPRRAEAAEVSTPFLAPLVSAVAATAPPTRSVAPARRAAPLPLPHPRAARRASTDLGEARGGAARVGASHPEGVDTIEVDGLDRLQRVRRSDGTVEGYGYNALGALNVNAGVPLETERPRLDGGGTASSGVPSLLGGQGVALDPGGRITSVRGVGFTFSRAGYLQQASNGSRFAVDAASRRAWAQSEYGLEAFAYEGSHPLCQKSCPVA